MEEKTTNVSAGELNYDSYESNIYDEDIVRSIPGHEELHQEIEKVIEEKKPERILELGVGTGLTSEKILKIVPEAKLIVVDFSGQMLSGAKKRLENFEVEFILGDYSEIDFGKDFDMVVSIIGIHHQKHEGKKKLFKKIFESLKDGGVFVFGDLMTYEDKKKAAFNDAKHFHHLVENARSEEALEDWAHHHKYLNLLAPLKDQTKWLEEIGFSKVEKLYEKFNTVLLVATK